MALSISIINQLFEVFLKTKTKKYILLFRYNLILLQNFLSIYQKT